jgi:hypothetical protein
MPIGLITGWHIGVDATHQQQTMYNHMSAQAAVQYCQDTAACESEHRRTSIRKNIGYSSLPALKDIEWG